MLNKSSLVPLVPLLMVFSLLSVLGLPTVTTYVNGQPPLAKYIISLDSFTIGNTASLHEDTDAVAMSVAINSENPISLSRDMGDVNNGLHVLN